MNTKRAVKCVETGECFESIAEAAQVKGCTRANISRALRKGGVAVGGHWRYSYTVKISEMEVRKARARVCVTPVASVGHCPTTPRLTGARHAR